MSDLRTRMLATAILFHDNDMLMMKRSASRTLSPGLWAAVGGHLEPEEINDPRAAVLREIHEETGLLEQDLRELKLQYILIRLNQQEIRQQFIYTAKAMKRTLTQTDEGELHWIPKELVLQREIPFIFHSLLEHYFSHGPSPHIWVGTAGFGEEQQAAVHWTLLIDPQML